MRTIKVWDPLVRMFHWTLVLSFLIGWISADEWDGLHLWTGYVAAALVAFRLMWGLYGPGYARFRQFVRSPGAVAAYLRDIALGRERRYIGHNPAGGVMILALLAGMAVLCVTGWLMTTDAFFGSEMLEDTHEAVANLMLLLVALHVGGVIVASLRHRENLVVAMLTGRKRAAADVDVS
jgi:cytochrome b